MRYHIRLYTISLKLLFFGMFILIIAMVTIIDISINIDVNIKKPLFLKEEKT